MTAAELANIELNSALRDLRSVLWGGDRRPRPPAPPAAAATASAAGAADAAAAEEPPGARAKPGEAEGASRAAVPASRAAVPHWEWSAVPDAVLVELFVDFEADRAVLRRDVGDAAVNEGPRRRAPWPAELCGQPGTDGAPGFGTVNGSRSSLAGRGEPVPRGAGPAGLCCGGRRRRRRQPTAAAVARGPTAGGRRCYGRDARSSRGAAEQPAGGGDGGQAQLQRYLSMHSQLDWLAVKQESYRRRRDQILHELEQAAAAAATARGRLASVSSRTSAGYASPTGPRSRASSYIAVHEGSDADDGFQIVTVTCRSGSSRRGSPAPLTLPPVP